MTGRPPPNGFDPHRRRFLSVAAATAGVALAPGVVLYGIGDGAAEARPGKAASPKIRWGLLIDVSKCAAGCDACVTACSREHGLGGHGRVLRDA